MRRTVVLRMIGQFRRRLNSPSGPAVPGHERDRRPGPRARDGGDAARPGVASARATAVSIKRWFALRRGRSRPPDRRPPRRPPSGPCRARASGPAVRAHGTTRAAARRGVSAPQRLASSVSACSQGRSEASSSGTSQSTVTTHRETRRQAVDRRPVGLLCQAPWRPPARPPRPGVSRSAPPQFAWSSPSSVRRWPTIHP